MPFVVLYDANVLYPSTLRDVLLRVAIHGLVQAKRTEEILDETSATSARTAPTSPSRRWPGRAAC
jgi:hypothetical protein